MIPILAFSINFYIKGEITVRNELLNAMRTQIMVFMHNFESEISNIKKLQYDFIYDDDIQLLNNDSQLIDNIDRTFAIRRLQRRLDLIKTSSTLIQDASLYLSSNNTVISATGGSRYIIEKINDERIKKLVAQKDETSESIIFKDNQLLMNLIPIYFGKAQTETPPFISEIILDMSELEQQISQINRYSEGECLLVNKSSNMIVIQTSDQSDYETNEALIQKLITDEEPNIKKVTLGNEKYWIMSEQSDIIGLKLIKYVSEDLIVGALKRYKVWLWLFSAVIFVIIIIYSLSTYRFIEKPLKTLILAFETVETGKLDSIVKYNYKDEFGYLYQKFNNMISNLKNLIEQVYKQKILAQKSELRQLQSQINPHFLYNSFFILNSMSRTADYDNLEMFTEQLGEYFKYITRSAKDEVPLVKEIEHARIYTKIQSMRFYNRIKVNFDPLPEEFNNISVPRLIIQPIIENAFEHGLEKKQKDGLLNIFFEKYEENLFISVENNGDVITAEDLDKLSSALYQSDDEHEITGIINIHKRLQLKFGEQSGLEFMQGSQGGIKVNIKLMIQEGKKNV